MKNLYKFLIPGIAILLSCEKSPVSEGQMAPYRSVYMKDAEQAPKNVPVFIQQEEQILQFNANVGGFGKNEQDIKVTFQVLPELVATFNAQKGTSYQSLPAGAYGLDNMDATIPAGELYSDRIKIKLTTQGHLIPGGAYLLPVGIKAVSGNVPVNESLKVAYFLLVGSYPLGKEPPTQAGEVPDAYVSIFTYYNFLSLVQSDGGGRLRSFSFNSQTGRFPTAESYSDGGWNYFSLVMPYDNRYVAREPNGALRTYSISSATGLASNMIPIGTGFNVYNLMTTSIVHKVIFGRNVNGELMAYPYTSGNIISHDQAINLGTGWNDYTKIIGYADGLLALDSAGELWYFAIKADKTLADKKLVGKGWNIYKDLIAFGTDLLALDNNRILWQYKFNIGAVWELN